MAKNANGLGSISYVMRDGKKYWTGRVSLGVDREGKQVRKSFSSFKKSTVVEKMKDYLQYTTTSGIFDTRKNILGPSIQHWTFNVKAKEVKSSTLSKYDHCLRLRILPHAYANMDIKDITVQNLQDFINFLFFDEDWSEGVVKVTLQIIRTFLDYCITIGQIQTNPAYYVKVPKERKIDQSEKYRIFSKDEQDKILKALDLKDPVEQMLYIDFFSGLRRSEIRALDISSYQRPNLIIDKQMARTYVFKDGKRQLHKDDIQTLKTTSSRRVVPLPNIALDLLDEVIEESKKKHEQLNIPFTSHSLLFVDDFCQPIEEKRANRRLQKVCRDLNLEPRPLHSIRHSYATRLFEAGIDIKTVQKLMGHSDYKTTMDVYTHVMPEKKIEAVSIFDKLYK